MASLSPSAGTRRPELDVLRLLIVLGLVFFHTARVFDTIPFPIKNDRQSFGVTAFVAFCSLWGMPLLFLIAGSGSWFSMQHRTWRRYVKERTRRLLIPLVFGVFVVVPPQGYYELRHRTGAHPTWWEYYPRFFDIRLGFPSFLEPKIPVGGFQLAHLWFLYDLFLFSLLLVPLSLWLRGGRGRRGVSRMAALAWRPGFIFLPGLALGGLEAALGTSMNGGWNSAVYLAVFFLGYLLVSEAGFGQAVERHAWLALGLALLSSLCVLAGFALSDRAGIDVLRGFAGWSLLLRFIKGGCCWFWLVALLGLGRKLSPRASPGASPLVHGAIRYASQAVLPFYVLHQTVIVIFAFYVVRWEVGAGVKYLVTSLSSLLVTLLLYELAVRRTRLTRFLFGMKPHPPGG